MTPTTTNGESNSAQQRHEDSLQGSAGKQTPSLQEEDSAAHKNKVDGHRNLVKKRSCSSTPDTSESLRKNIKKKQSTITSHEENVQLIKTDKEKIACELRELGVHVLEKREVEAMSVGVCDTLGWGAQGSCIKTVHPHTRQHLVIKTFFHDDVDSLVQETMALQVLQMPGLQRLIGVCVETCQIVTLFAGMTADKYFEKHVSLADAVTVFLQLAKTSKNIVEKGFTHNDMKSNNVCVSDESSDPVVTIIDLGLVTPIGTWSVLWTRTHPDQYPWLPPELITHTHPTSEASDVYRLGSTMVRLLLLDEEYILHPLLDDFISWLVEAILPDPAHRPTMAALVKLLETLHEEVSNIRKM